ncbi:two-component system, OmpR family, copper resistance phosphate regulon response regulator CusR, partial [Pseudomonas sp. NFACC39-1]
MKKSSGSAEAGSDSSLRLDPLHIPNIAPAFEDYAGGIGVALVEDGLKCYVDLWFPNGDGDAIAFYWNNTQTPVWSDTIDANPPDRLRIHLNRGFILEGDAEPVFYSVTRLGQIPVDSPPQKILVKLLRPGGYDDDPTTPGHSGLRYTIAQEIIDNGVGPIEADAGVDVTILH